MRWLRLALAVVVVSSTGCSALIASRGQDLSELTTKKVVHATFAKSVVRDGEDSPYDEFRTHRKISENWRCEYLAMAGVCTLGLAEFVNVPCELFRAVRQRIVGQTLRFEYNADGAVTRVTSNGEPVHWAGPYGGRYTRSPRYSPHESTGAGP